MAPELRVQLALASTPVNDLVVDWSARFLIPAGKFVEFSAQLTIESLHCTTSPEGRWSDELLAQPTWLPAIAISTNATRGPDEIARKYILTFAD